MEKLILSNNNIKTIEKDNKIEVDKKKSNNTMKIPKEESKTIEVKKDTKTSTIKDVKTESRKDIVKKIETKIDKKRKRLFKIRLLIHRVRQVDLRVKKIV